MYPAADCCHEVHVRHQLDCVPIMFDNAHSTIESKLYLATITQSSKLDDNKQHHKKGLFDRGR